MLRLSLHRFGYLRGSRPWASALCCCVAIAIFLSPLAALSASGAGTLRALSGQRVVVQPGETLWRISRRYGMTAMELARHNNISDPTQVRAGHVLLVPTAEAKPAPVATVASVTKSAPVATVSSTPKPTPVATVASAPKPGLQRPTNEKPKNVATSDTDDAETAKEQEQSSPPPGGMRREASPDTTEKAPELESKSEPKVEPKLTSASKTESASSVDAGPRPQPRKEAKPEINNDNKLTSSPRVKAEAKPEGDDAPGEYPLRWPVDGRVVARFGTRNGVRHDGIDIAVSSGTKVRSADAGRVVFAGQHGGYGNLIIVRHDSGLVTIYAHNKRNLVRRGQRVTGGQDIALVGAAKRTGAVQLHFEVREGVQARNPMKFLPP